MPVVRAVAIHSAIERPVFVSRFLMSDAIPSSGDVAMSFSLSVRVSKSDRNPVSDSGLPVALEGQGVHFHPLAVLILGKQRRYEGVVVGEFGLEPVVAFFA